MFFDIDKAVNGKTFKDCPLDFIKEVVGEVAKLRDKNPSHFPDLSAVCGQAVFEEVLGPYVPGQKAIVVKDSEGLNYVPVGDIRLYWMPWCPQRSVLFVSRPSKHRINFPAVLGPRVTFYGDN